MCLPKYKLQSIFNEGLYQKEVPLCPRLRYLNKSNIDSAHMRSVLGNLECLGSEYYCSMRYFLVIFGCWGWRVASITGFAVWGAHGLTMESDVVRLVRKRQLPR